MLMANTISPNMSLVVPAVGNEAGPTYAFDVNTSLTLIDQHDHSPGKGVRITPAGININATLNFNNNTAANLASLSMIPQGSPTSNVDSISTSAVSGIAELWYTDSNGTQTQITSNGTVNATVASVSGLTYNIIAASTWAFNQAQSSLPTTPANLSIGSLILQPNVASTTVSTELVPPSSGNYTIGLPVPQTEGYTGVPNFVTMDQSGQQTNTYFLDNTTLNASGNAVQVKPGGITTTQISSSAGILKTQLAASAFEWDSQAITTSGTFTVPTGVNFLLVEGCGGGGGGGGGGGANNFAGGGGAGGAGATPQIIPLTVTPGASLTVTIGAGGAGGGGAGGSTGTLGTKGSDGTESSIANGATIIALFGAGAGGLGGTGGNANNPNNASPNTSWSATTYAGYAASATLGGGGGVGETAGGGNNGGDAGVNLFTALHATKGSAGTVAGGTASGGGGGGGGSGYAAGGNGGNGGSSSGANGSNGTAAVSTHYGAGGGAGGGGGKNGGSNFSGGNGAAGAGGQIIIYWQTNS